MNHPNPSAKDLVENIVGVSLPRTKNFKEAEGKVTVAEDAVAKEEDLPI